MRAGVDAAVRIALLVRTRVINVTALPQARCSVQKGGDALFGVANPGCRHLRGGHFELAPSKRLSLRGCGSCFDE